MSDYRQQALRCPACDGLLDELVRGELHVDVCPGCRGLFIDWLDGDVSDVVRAVGALPIGVGSEKEGTGACPRCNVPLHGEEVGPDPTSILRCGACAASFVSRDAFERLKQVARPEGEEPREGADPFLTRLLDTIGRVVGLRD